MRKISKISLSLIMAALTLSMLPATILAKSKKEDVTTWARKVLGEKKKLKAVPSEKIRTLKENMPSNYSSDEVIEAAYNVSGVSTDLR